jgi:3-methyladenine DNA glycosylase/8-oxoguanine DNA glycosylase
VKEALAINHLKKSDRVLGQLIERIGAYQLSKRQLEGDLFFCLSRSILHQQLSTKVAQIIHTRFLQLYEVVFEIHHRFLPNFCPKCRCATPIGVKGKEEIISLLDQSFLSPLER